MKAEKHSRKLPCHLHHASELKVVNGVESVGHRVAGGPKARVENANSEGNVLIVFTPRQRRTVAWTRRCSSHACLSRRPVFRRHRVAVELVRGGSIPDSLQPLPRRVVR